jgi:hypothetical protein
MYLLLVTNRNSNILEDLDTLRLLSKLVPEYAGSMLDEEAISRAAFDLIFAFDEVISLGHKENITVQQVKQNCEMESHEEKLHKMIIQSKINDTKDIMKRKAIEIDKTKVDQKRMMPVGPGYNPAMSGMSGKVFGHEACCHPQILREEPCTAMLGVLVHTTVKLAEHLFGSTSGMVDRAAPVTRVLCPLWLLVKVLRI